MEETLQTGLQQGIDLLKPPSITLASKEDCFLSHTIAKLISGICAFLAFMISTKLIIKHLRYYTKPDEQRWILRLIFIVPIYSFISFISLLLFGNNSSQGIFICLDSVRSCYEAFVIYSFLSLCFNGYLGGEGKIVNALNGRPLPSSYKTLTCCIKNKSFSIQTLRFCKQATLQFCVVKILVTVLTLILESEGLYHQGNFNPKYGFVYLMIIQNISISTALWSLALFYLAGWRSYLVAYLNQVDNIQYVSKSSFKPSLYLTTKEILSPYYPLLKFVTVKSVIFLSFWQGAVIALLEVTGYINDIENIPKGVVATGWQNFLTSVEMFLAAVAFWVAFSYKPYVPVRFDEINNPGNLEKGGVDPNNNNIPRPDPSISGTGNPFYGSINSPSQASTSNTSSSVGNKNSRGKYLSKVPKFDALTNTLKDSLDPRDIFQDAVHNFSNRYSPYYNAPAQDDDEMLVDNEVGRNGSSRDETHIN